MYRWKYNYRSTLVIILLSVLHLNVAAQESEEEPPEIVCGLDLNGNGSFAEDGETTFCEPTTTPSLHSCPLGRVSCHSVEIPVSSCLPRTTHIQDIERLAADAAEEAAVLAETLAEESAALYQNMVSDANRLNGEAHRAEVQAELGRELYREGIITREEYDRRVASATYFRTQADAAAVAVQNQLPITEALVAAATEARRIADETEITTDFPELYDRQVVCPITGNVFTAPFNPSIEDLALRDRSCALSCDGDPQIIDETVWISPIDGRSCINLLDPSYIDEVTGVIDFVGAANEPPNMVVSPSNCYEKEQEFLDVSEEYYEDNDTIDSDTGECEGEFQIFSGKVSGCRSNGYQTRWDNCCNNGEKIITDSFSEKTTAERLEGIATMVSDAFGGALGTGAGASIAGLISDGFSILPRGLDPLEATGIIGNWLLTPCSKESENVSKMASGMCMYVGEKCIEKWFGIGCVQHAQVHCCFKTKLAKIFHEQARQQFVGLDWGSAQDANCRGFTPEEFQAIDFSRIDLGEYEPDVVHRPINEMQDDLLNGAPQISLPNSGG